MNDFQKKELELMIKTAREKGGECLSTIYINSHTKYEFIDSDGNKFTCAWYSIKGRGSWSPFQATQRKINKLRKYTITDLIEHANSKQGQCISTEYLGLRKKHEWQDSLGRIFYMTWMNVLAGQWSPFEKASNIGNLKRKYTNEEFREYCRKEHNVEFLSEQYLGMNKSYKFKDLDTGKEFSRHLSTLKKTGKLQNKTISAPEEEISDFLNSLNISYVKNDRKILKGKELDFYIPSLNIAIEFHGLKWHTFNRVGNLHKEKQIECKKNGIKLIQIFEHEWNDRKQQVKSFLTSCLGKNTIMLNARDCDFGILDKSIAKDILNKTHIQGSGNFDRAYTLFHNKMPVMLITIGKHHMPNGTPGPVLTRCVAISNVTVRGGLSKLCKNVYQKEGSFITWVDLRWSDGMSWLNNGWVFEKELAPDYFYYNQNYKKVIKKSARRKSKINTNMDITEREQAILDGLEMVKDAGKIRMIYKP